MSRAERKGNRDAQRVGDILRGYLAHKETTAVVPRQRIEEAWTRLCRREGFGRTRIAGLRGKDVIIEVESPPLCAELAQFRSRELLQQMQRELGDHVRIDSLRFRLGAFT